MIADVAEALEAVRHGRMVVVVDGRPEGGHGDLVLAAEHVGPRTINFMAREARGLICLALTPERCERLGLEPLQPRGVGPEGPMFTESIEARTGVTTGISVHDRAHTVKVAIDPAAGAEAICSPGHMLPLRGRAGGVLERPGKTEASIDLARLAGLSPAGVLCGIMSEDGTMATGAELLDFCGRHGIPMLPIDDLVAHRRSTERLLRRSGETAPTGLGGLRSIPYEELHSGRRHLGLVLGDPLAAGSAPAHIHRACPLGDRRLAPECRAAELLGAAVREIERRGCGAIAYLDVDAEAAPDCCAAGHGPLLRPVDEAVGRQIIADLGFAETQSAVGVVAIGA